MIRLTGRSQVNRDSLHLGAAAGAPPTREGAQDD